MQAVITILQACLNHWFICEPPTPPPISYYQEGYACYVDGIFHQKCPKPDYLTKPPFNPYNKSNR